MEDIYINFDDSLNPTIQSPNCQYPLYFRQSEATLMDIEYYKKFIENCISRFRHSRCYKNYKAYLYDIGFNRCQFLSNINSDIADLEMHHVITIYDITLLITEWFIKTQGSVTSFEVVMKLKEEHKNNNIPIIMVSKSVHQMIHANPEFVVPPQMVFGYWIDLLQKYKEGITIELANKVIGFLKRGIELEQNNSLYRQKLLETRQDVLDFSQYNNCCITPRAYTEVSY